MKSIFAVATLVAALSLCNLTDRTKPTATPSPDAASKAQAERQTALAELLQFES